jgi:putative heme-binding domain-containing protein
MEKMLALAGTEQRVAHRLLVWSTAAFTLALVPCRSPAAQDDAAIGQQTYSACAACHGLDGKGGEHAPNIATDPNVRRMSDAAILTIVRNGIPAAGMPGFSRLLSGRQIQEVLHYLRTLQGSGAKVNLPGDRNRGRELFFGHAGCAECHMVNGRGGFFAADLSTYGSGVHSPAEIRDAIVAPDKNLDPRRGTVSVVTRRGASYRGALRNEDNFSLQMQTADGRFHLFDKSDLVRINHESRSLMPNDYRSKLTGSELDDLVTFLAQTTSGKKADNDEEQE